MNKKIIHALVAASFVASIAAPALAQTSTTTPMTSAKKTINVACIQNAVETRDSAIISAVSTHATAQTSALSARKSALKTAWAITDQKARRDALRNAWKAFSAASQSARKMFRDAQHAAWKKFNTDRKACGTQGMSDDAGDEGHDSQL